MSVSRAPHKLLSCSPPPAPPRAAREGRRAAASAGRGAVRAAAVGAAIEMLEERQLFVTLNAGDQFIYSVFQGTGPGVSQIEINVGPGVVAEIVGARGTQIGDMSGLLNGTPVNGGGQNDLYAIYVAQSTSHSWITVTARRLREPAQAPFQGAVGNLAITNTEGESGTVEQPITIAPGADTGRAYLGGRIGVRPGDAAQAAPFRPITTAPVTPIGVIPGDANIQAGFYVADGNDFGTFIFDGTVTGRVDVGGSMNTFYAGWVLTGDATGEVGVRRTATVSVPDNFNVDGDLRNLVSVDSIGTEDYSGIANDDPRYLSGFDLQVGGQLGQVVTRDAFAGKIDVVNDPAVVGINRAYNELEYVVVPRPAGPGQSFLRDLITADDLTDPIRNDTFQTPQILGSFEREVPGLGRQFVAEVNGLLQSTPPLTDQADYYGVALMAGQKVVVDLSSAPFDFDGDGIIDTGIDTDGDGVIDSGGSDLDGDGVIEADENSAFGLNIGIFDPDGRLIASDYSNSLTQLIDVPIGFTADRPGLYRIAVATINNVDFLGPGINNLTVPYNILVRGVGELGMGGLAATNRAAAMTELTFDPTPIPTPTPTPTPIPTFLPDPGWRIRRGDLGAIEAGGAMHSLISPTLGDRTVAVDTGDLRSINAATIGTLGGNVFDVVGIEVPVGSIGVLSTPRNRLGEPDLTTGSISIQTTADELGAPIAIGRNIQLISAGGNFFGDLRVNGGIGVIRAGQIATTNDFTQLFVDFDRTGRDGIIDLIESQTDLGSLTGGGIAIDTGVGGNVRYIQANGELYLDTFFGGGSLSPNQYAAGEEAVVVDDSGSRIRLIPTGGAAGTSGPNMSVTTYPIRSGGSVLIDVTSDGNLEVEGIGAGSAEVSRMEIRGTGRRVISESDLDVPPPPDVSAERGDLEDDELQLEPSSATATSLEALITGGIVVDVLDVVVTRPAGGRGGGGNPTTKRNETPRERDNVLAASIGALWAGRPHRQPHKHTGAPPVRGRALTFTDNLTPSPRGPRQSDSSRRRRGERRRRHVPVPSADDRHPGGRRQHPDDHLGHGHRQRDGARQHRVGPQRRP